jgi:hypothetical protein
MVCVVNDTALPPRVMPLNVPLGPFVGSMACRLRAPEAWLILKLSVFPLHANEPKEELFRPSSHVNICNEDTMGTPFA